MAGTRYQVVDSSGTAVKSNGDVESSIIVVSYDGVAYADANGHNIVFATKAEKKEYESNTGNSCDIYYWQYEPDNVSSSVTYYVSELEIHLNSDYKSSSASNYWYNSDSADKFGSKSIYSCGFSLDTNEYEVTLSANATASLVKTIESTDKAIFGKLKLRKTSTTGSYPSIYDMTGAEFTVYDSTNTAIGKFTIEKQDDTTYVGIPSIDGFTNIGQDAETSDVTSGTAYNYLILPLGTYTIKETTGSAEGYVMNNYEWTLKVAVDSDGNIYETLSDGTTSKNYTDVSSVIIGNSSFTNDNTPAYGRVSLYKTSDLDVSSLGDYYDMSGAVYTLYSDDDNTGIFSSSPTALATFTTYTNSSNVTVGVPSVTTAGSKAGLSCASSTSNLTTANNYINLPIGIYYVTETTAAKAGYTVNSNIRWRIEVTLDSSTSKVTTTLKKQTYANGGWTAVVVDSDSKTYSSSALYAAVIIGETYNNRTESSSTNNNIELTKRGSASLRKQSSNNCISDNALYDMTGAEYTLYYYYNGSYQAVGTYVTKAATGADEEYYVGIPQTTTFGSSLGITAVSDTSTVTTAANYFKNLPFGKYKVEETKAPDNYTKDEDIQIIMSDETVTNEFEITEDNYSTKAYISSTDTPFMDPFEITVTKVDEETGESYNNGADLSGIQFTVKYYDTLDADSAADLANVTPERTWVIETVKVEEYDNITKETDVTYRADLSTIIDSLSDELYYDNDGITPMIPSGCITIEETASNDSYTTTGELQALTGTTLTNGKIEDNVYFCKSEIEEDEVDKLQTVVLSKSDQIKRADIKFTKVDVRDGSTMAGVAFKLTNNRTGESHILVSDDDGVVDTSAEYKLHTYNTNANDNADVSDYASCGIWFSVDGEETIDPDDTLGALPYDTYTLSEIDTDGNEGYVLLSDLTIDLADASIYDENGYVLIDLGTITNVPEPNVSTTVFTTEAIILKSDDSDTDSTSDYTDNTEEATTEESTTEEGSTEEVTEEKVLITTDRILQTMVNDILNATSNGVTSLTESNTEANTETNTESNTETNTGSNTKTDTDSDTDSGEVISTGTNDNVLPANAIVTVKDSFKYEYLLSGETYTVKGILIDKSTGKPYVDTDGNYVTGMTTFTLDEEYEKYPEEKCGTVDVYFTIDTSDLDGHSFVVYEYLFLGETTDALVINDDGTIDETGVYTTNTGKVMKHDNFDDEAQTLHIPEVHTSLSDSETGDSISSADSLVTLIDTVSCTNLVVGKEYTINGTLMNKDTGNKMVDAEGNEITASKTFIATESDMEVQIVFTFDGSLLAGATTVAFERLTHENIEVATHTDLTDKDQTVYFPKVHTTLTDKATGTHLANPDTETTLIDTVNCTNLDVGKEYTINGSLVDKDTGEVLIDTNGDYVTASTTFTATEAEMNVDVVFTFDATIFAEKSSVAFESLTHNGKEVAVHANLEDEGQTVTFTNIGTTLTDSVTGEHFAYPSSEVTLVDTVTYANLTIGETYTVEGVLMNKETGEELLDTNGKTITASEIFVAETEYGSIDIVFTFDGSLLAGTTTVAFETIYYEGVDIATHADLEDEGQTVHFPTGHTVAKDKDTGTHEGKISNNVTITDTVYYENLVTEKEYTVTGTLMDKSTGEKYLDNNGNEVTSTVTFTPTESTGTVTVTFNFDGSNLKDKSLVVFERMTYGEYDTDVFIHEDMNDEDQTVYYSDSPKTGDSKMPIVVGIVLIVAFVGIGGLVIYKKRRKKTTD